MKFPPTYRPIGAIYDHHSCQFTVWAPEREQVNLVLVAPVERLIPMTRDKGGYWRVDVPNLDPNTTYLYELDGKLKLPDPASFYQPLGVHQPSQVLNHQQFTWQDQNWQATPLTDWIIYELHVGTFTPQGDFSSIIPKLPTLQALGINTLELMPVAQFPGERNWGYDGVYPFAVQNSYGGPQKLKELVNAAHQQGFNLILDVVYNHLGPEGCYLSEYGPYFTDKYRTPWGMAFNYDDAYSDGVRNFIINNALYWLREYHFDGLRIDAIHGIYDFSAQHVLAEIATAVDKLSEEEQRKLYLIAESDLNDCRVIQSTQINGLGMAAQWSDDFHHSLHTLLTGEKVGYYQDFGCISHLTKAINQGFVYGGEYSQFRKRYHGNYAGDRPPWQFVVCSQNHDQVGNRMKGDRLATLVTFAQLQLAAATVLLSPFIPLLFMGEEYGETRPFLYFIDHNDPDLITAVREGRKAEFADFHREDPPDAASQETFTASILDWEKINQGKHQQLWQFYQRLIQLRCSLPCFKRSEKPQVTSYEQLLCFNYQQETIIALNFSPNSQSFTLPEGNWRQVIQTENSQLPLNLTANSSLILSGHSLVIYSQT